jgi:hypothetical protein
VPGELSVHFLERPEGGVMDPIALASWEILEALRGSAGDEPESAECYSGNIDLLLEPKPTMARPNLAERPP